MWRSVYGVIQFGELCFVVGVGEHGPKVGQANGRARSVVNMRDSGSLGTFVPKCFESSSATDAARGTMRTRCVLVVGRLISFPRVSVKPPSTRSWPRSFEVSPAVGEAFDVEWSLALELPHRRRASTLQLPDGHSGADGRDSDDWRNKWSTRRLNLAKPVPGLGTAPVGPGVSVDRASLASALAASWMAVGLRVRPSIVRGADSAVRIRRWIPWPRLS